MNPEKELQESAESYIKKHRKDIAQNVTNTEIYLSEEKPVSIFMAGSPGAGKTEISTRLIEIFESNPNQNKIIRIDPDDFRNYVPGYTGSNSHLFQKHVSILVTESVNCALESNQSFLLDGTFSNYERAVLNIDRSLKRSRFVFVFYVYQEPKVAWQFTQAREETEGRRIEKDEFIKKFLASKEVVKKILQRYKDRIVVALIIKNFESHDVKEVVSLSSDTQVDDYIKNTYTDEDIRKLL